MTVGWFVALLAEAGKDCMEVQQILSQMKAQFSQWQYEHPTVALKEQTITI